MNYTFKEIRKNVFLVESITQYDMCSMFLRPQEFYESPYDEIQGKYFKLEQYMDIYAEDKGAFTYYTDWAGFNIPSTFFRKFFEVFSYDLSKKEIALFQGINRLRTNLESGFYVIGACKEKKNQDVIAHEIAHANWFLYPDYKEKMINLINEIPCKLYDKASDTLRNLGYTDSVIIEEIHAYIATGKRSQLISFFNWPQNSKIKIPKSIRKFYEEFNSTYG